MIRRTTTTLALTATLAACGGGSSGGNGNLPSGLPAGTGGAPALQPVSDAIPEAQRLSVGGLDSTAPDWDYFRTLPSTGTSGAPSELCAWLLTAMLSDRGDAEERVIDGELSQTWWYWSQGYVIEWDWSGDECQAEDWRFEPQL